MDRIYLVNYRHRNCEPMKSITQLPREEAFQLAAKLYEDNPCSAHRRFGPDFPVYYSFRLKTEEWLYDHFIALGGKPKTKHPYYFALQQCESLKRNFGFGEEYRLGLDLIDETDISFTFGDSIKQMNSPQRIDPFMKPQLLQYLSRFDNDLNRLIDSLRDTYIIIEAQMWTDKYFNMNKSHDLSV